MLEQETGYWLGDCFDHLGTATSDAYVLFIALDRSLAAAFEQRMY